MRNNGWGRVNVAVVARSQREAAATITTAATKQHPLNISNIHTCCTNIIFVLWCQWFLVTVVRLKQGRVCFKRFTRNNSSSDIEDDKAALTAT